MGRRNLQGGSKTKSMARKATYGTSSTRITESDEEKYAIVKSVSGNGRFRVTTSDKKTHVAILPGSMRGHKKRHNYVGLDSIVLINDRSSWQTVKDNSTADIVHVYNPADVERLELKLLFQETVVESNITFSANPSSAVSESTKVVEFEDTMDENEQELDIDLI